MPFGLDQPTTPRIWLTLIGAAGRRAAGRRAVTSLVAVIATFGVAIVVPPSAPAENWTVERVVMLMRHGVRPPLDEPAVPATIAPDPWPTWQVPAGWLTEHGAAAIRLLGVADAKWLAQEGVLPDNGCPRPGTLVIHSDSAERTIATGDAFLTTLTPHCGIQNQHQDRGVPDPLFTEYPDAGLSAVDAQAAINEVLGPGGIAAVEGRARPAVDIVTRIVCGNRSGACGVSDVRSDVIVEPSGRVRPKLTGGLAYASTIAQTLLLEYAEGRPMEEVGWGRATAEEIEAIGVLHSLEFGVIARPRVLAFANAGKIAQTMLDAVRDGPPLTILVGHDTEVANLGGILDVHWKIPGYAEDDPAPGGALGFEVVRDRDGQRFVRTFYRTQTPDQIRSLSDEPPVRVTLAIPGCDGQTLCPLDKFTALLETARR
jgi:4-phytase / acid phosphatase